jgi:hypothetical protein
LKQLRLRQQQEQQDRMRAREYAIRGLDNTNKRDRNLLVEVFRRKSEDLLAKFKKDQIALKCKRDAEDSKRAQELYQVRLFRDGQWSLFLCTFRIKTDSPRLLKHRVWCMRLAVQSCILHNVQLSHPLQ